MLTHHIRLTFTQKRVIIHLSREGEEITQHGGPWTGPDYRKETKTMTLQEMEKKAGRIKLLNAQRDSIDTEINGTLEEIEHYYSSLGASRVEFIA